MQSTVQEARFSASTARLSGIASQVRPPRGPEQISPAVACVDSAAFGIWFRVKFQVYRTGRENQNSSLPARRDSEARLSLRKRGEEAFYLLRRGEVPVAVLRTRSTRVDVWEPQEAMTLLAELERTIRQFRPQVLLTYGGDAVARAIIELGKRHGLSVVFGLHNFAYHDRQLFRNVDRVIVPSEFSRRWYRERLGLECDVLPYAIDWNRVQVSGERRAESRGPEEEGKVIGDRLSVIGGAHARRFVTFVSPQPAKGLFVFARIAEQIARRRPDIPILVVEGRERASWLEQGPVDLSWATNLYAMENTPDPRDFYAVTKLLLMPSLWNESFGLVAVEAMINGIPVLASNRGGLPEVVGDAAYLFDIPGQYTPESCLVPPAGEVEAWVKTIIRLWDDRPSYDLVSEQARARAQFWHPDQLGPVYAGFFSQLKTRRGGPRVS